MLAPITATCSIKQDQPAGGDPFVRRSGARAARMRRARNDAQTVKDHFAPLTYPSVKVCMKATRASSSSLLRPRLPSCRVFMFAATSGAGQQEIFSPGSFGAQRGKTSRVL